jgi:hypothetical protein
MIDSETKRAWRRLRKEVRENAPVVLRGLASSAKRIPGRIYSVAVRCSESLARRVKAWDVSFSGRKAVISRLSRVRLRSPIYKV